MKKYFLISLLVSTSTFAQVNIKGSISGYGKNQAIEYFSPIGKFANFNKYSTTFKIESDSTFNLSLDIKDTIFIKVRIATEPIYLLVKPGDSITVNLKNTKDHHTFLAISGTNASANQWYNMYMFSPGAVYAKHDPLIKLIPSSTGAELKNWLSVFINSQYKPLDSLAHIRQIDNKSLELFEKQISISHYSTLINDLNYAYNSSKDPTIRKKIIALKEVVYNDYHPLDPSNLKFMYSTSLFLFTNVKDFVKNPLPINKEDLVFGVYNQYLLLPSLFIENLIGGALIIQKRQAANEFDFESGYAVFKRRFPQSAFLPIIDGYSNREKQLKSVKNPEVIIDSSASYNKLADIIKANEGHNIYIDLWATWCIPCREEFASYPGLYETFIKYDLKTIFISIDDPIMKNNWKKIVSASNLTGIHYLSNSSLLNEIKKDVYNGGKVMIPRYILVNKKGEIIDVDAPRPSQRGDLINTLDKKL